MDESKSKNRRLSPDEQMAAKQTLDQVRQLIKQAAREDKAHIWALRRYIYIRLQHDERGKPLQRKMLKLKRMVSQKGKCAICGESLPERGAELDRFNAMDGYTEQNTRLVCHRCHRKSQEERGFA
jgi:hypothetical protein